MSSVHKLCLLWQLLLLAVGVMTADLSYSRPAASVPCYRKCPPGQHCEVAPYPTHALSHCVDDLKPTPPPPQRCGFQVCNATQICLPQIVMCIVAPCPAIKSCVNNRCLAVRCGTGTVCNTRRNPNPKCNGAECWFSPECVPRAEPRPGFCPPPDSVSHSNVNQCQYDNDCPLDELCCPGTSKGGRSCIRPLHPDPCSVTKCPPSADIIGGTCVVRDGVASCVDRVCQPGSFFCRKGFQCYCSDSGEVVCTDVPAPRDCKE